MNDKVERYRKETLQPLQPLILKRPNGSQIIVNALGLAMVKPAVDFVQHTTTAGGRSRMESIGFTDQEFDQLYDFLTEAKKHWEGDK